MISGFIITTRDTEEIYTGIDCAGGETGWRNIDIWNELSPAYRIDINKGGVFQEEFTELMFKYYNWLKEVLSSQNHSVLYFTDAPQKLYNFKNFELQLLGYDCIYLENDEEESLSFSSLLHEVALSEYKKDINSFGLFNSIGRAAQYINIREGILKAETANLETAFMEYDMKIVETYLVSIP